MCCLYARARAYVPFVCVLNQYFNSACRLSWVSQFDGILLYFIILSPALHVNDVCKNKKKIKIYIYIYIYAVYVYTVCTVCM